MHKIDANIIFYILKKRDHDTCLVCQNSSRQKKENITWIIKYGQFNLSIKKKEKLFANSVLQPNMLKLLIWPVQVASV